MPITIQFSYNDVVFNIDNLSREELHDLNRQIVHRINYLNQCELMESSKAFHLGQKVEFSTPSNEHVAGTVIRINKKTISIATAQGQWNISPRILSQLLSGKKVQPNLQLIK